MEIQIKLTGYALILLALIHVIFPSYFKWKEELARISLINRQMMWVHTLFLALVLFLMGILCISSANDLVHTPLGQKIALGLSIFWGLRLLIQFFGYSSTLWKGKLFETTVHVLFVLLWLYLTVLFVYIYYSNNL